LKLDYATKAPGAYPIILVTYEIVCSKYSDAKIGALVSRAS
jgi:phosphate transport system substrate-binding protein